jgi:hypothetical protein
MNVGTAGKRATGANEGIVSNVESNVVMRTDEVAEERDLVGVYLHEISRTPLLDAATEVDLSKAIEAGLYAEHLLDEGQIPKGVSQEELERVVVEGERAKALSPRASHPVQPKRPETEATRSLYHEWHGTGNGHRLQSGVLQSHEKQKCGWWAGDSWERRQNSVRQGQALDPQGSVARHGQDEIAVAIRHLRVCSR